MGAASMNYITRDSSATSGGGTAADYTPAAGVLNFLAGETIASFTVATLNDTTADSGEFVTLVLGGGNVGGPPSKLTINEGGSTGTTPPAIASPSIFQFAQANYIDPSFVAPTSFFYGSSPDPIIEGGDGVVTANRIGNTSVSPSVDYLIADPGVVQPVNNVDYTVVCVFPVCPTGDMVNFNSGQTSVSLTMNNPLGWTSGVVNLGFGQGANIGTPPSTNITLI